MKQAQERSETVYSDAHVRFELKTGPFGMTPGVRSMLTEWHPHPNFASWCTCTAAGSGTIVVATRKGKRATQGEIDSLHKVARDAAAAHIAMRLAKLSESRST